MKLVVKLSTGVFSEVGGIHEHSKKHPSHDFVLLLHFGEELRKAKHIDGFQKLLQLT